MSDGYPFVDLALSRRLERAEAVGNARFVDSRARVTPSSGGCWIEVAGAYAMFDGAASPVTQTFGLGMFERPRAADLARMETFFTERGAPTFHEVSPLADETVLPLLTERGYRPIEFTSVMYRPVGPAGLKLCATSPPDMSTSALDRATSAPDKGPGVADLAAHAQEVAQGFSPAVTVRRVEPGEEDLYARTSAAGWSHAGLDDFITDIARIHAVTDGVSLYLAELDGQPIATAALGVVEGVAHLAGASTIPEGRQRGAQLALLDHRLRDAAAQGCDIALMGALPGSGSQRNAERHGFRIAYTRIKWQR